MQPLKQNPRQLLKCREYGITIVNILQNSDQQAGPGQNHWRPTRTAAPSFALPDLILATNFAKI